MKRILLLATFAAALTGCATTATLNPGFYKGEPKVGERFPIQVAYQLSRGKETIYDPCSDRPGRDLRKRWVDVDAAMPVVEKAIQSLYLKARPANLGSLLGRAGQEPSAPDDQLLLYVAIVGAEGGRFAIRAMDPEYRPTGDAEHDGVLNSYYAKNALFYRNVVLGWPKLPCPLSSAKLARIYAANIPKAIDQIVAVLSDPNGISRYPQNKAEARWQMIQARKAAQKDDYAAAFPFAAKAVALPPEGSHLDREIRPEFLKVAAKAKVPPVPEAADEIMLRARELTRLERYAQAEEEYKKVIALAPWWPQAYFNRAVSAESRAKKIMPLPLDLKKGEIGFVPDEYTDALDLARRMYNYYLLAAPEADDRERIRTRILQLSF